MSHDIWVPVCAICKQSVDLCRSNTDEFGRAVHEQCYVSNLLARKRQNHHIRMRAAPERFRVLEAKPRTGRSTQE